MREDPQSHRFDESLSEDRRFRLLVEAIRDYAIYMLSPQGIVTSWNRGATRFKGYQPHEIIGQHFSVFYTEEDKKSGLPQRALETAEREGTFEIEGWRVRKGGTRFWAHVVIDPVRSQTGDLVGFAKITRDLTERKDAADALRRSEEQFRILVQGVTDYAIYMLDPQGRITNWNVGAERLKGYKPDEIIGESFARFYSEEERAKGIPFNNLRIAEQEGRFEKEGWRIRKDGSQFWANVVIDPARDGAGNLIGFAKITRDFTERRQGQLALEQAREALFQAQKMEAIGQLTGGVAHDFNNLLMAILGSLELVRKRVPNDPKITPLIDNAVLAGKRGASLTQRMLMFARRQPLEPEPTDLAMLLNGMRELFQSSIGPDIRIETRFPIALPHVRIDPNQLESAVLNLCINARDAMSDGGQITISGEAAQHEQMTRRCVLLSVKDNGAGMDDDTLARASEPFFTTKGVGKGTGLGLAMVKGFVEQSGGRFVIRSERGRGTTAELWLPIAESHASQRVEAEHEEDEPINIEPLVVLAVDDDPLVLLNARAMLEDLGHTVVTATSGAEAVEILDRIARVDLLITDQAMPNMTGLQLAAVVQEQWPEVPIIIATGYDEMPTGAHGRFEKLKKPYFQSDLNKAIMAATKASVQADR
ncbi:MAG: hybrid sensor histidine kinase/response regulator [Rhodospirillum sp.]|nr:hybrid sensor histidine kinase/response regulator [Rhodospirillum sp.]